MSWESLLLALKHSSVGHFFISAMAGIVSFILTGEDRTWRSFFGEIVIAIFVGVWIAAPIASAMELTQPLTNAFVAVSAVSARRIVILIKSNYGEGVKKLLAQWLKVK